MEGVLKNERGIFNVSLSSRHRFHVGGVGHNQLEVAFKLGIPANARNWQSDPAAITRPPETIQQND